MSRPVRILTATDLHQSAALYTQLAGAVERHCPDILALVGDFLDCSGTSGAGDGLLPVEQCAEILVGMKLPQILLIRGNHEDFNFIPFAEALASGSGAHHTLHGEAFQRGPMTVVGFPCLLGDETAFALHKRPLAPRWEGWLPPLIRKIGPAARTLWLMHEPPAGTPLSAPAGPIAGNREWTDAIHRFSPRVVICGHDHRSPRKNGKWHHRLGESLLVNAGQSDGDPLHFTVVEAAFDSAESASPRKMTIHAFPWHQSVEWPPS